MGTGRGLRSESDPRSTFFAGAERKRQVVLAETEAVLTKLLQRLKKGEIPRRVLANYFVPCAGPVGCGKSCPRSGDRTFFNVNHRLALHSGRSIAYAAAWMGRLKTLQRLVCEFAAALDCEDDNGFTPLAVAAWAGHTKVVNWILSIGITLGDMDKKGVPPMTSSCGGKVLRPCISAQHGALFFFCCGAARRFVFDAGASQGPFTALEWVRRKRLPGWQNIEKSLIKAGAADDDGSATPPSLQAPGGACGFAPT